MRFEPTNIRDVVLIRPDVFKDSRGYFLESWEAHKFADAGVAQTFVQSNHSRSVRHVLRGLHYQVRQPQGKLVRVATGAVFDVAVDLRRSSPTFGRWVGYVLSEQNHCMLWVPPGFAHGFLVLSDVADFLYQCTDFWSPGDERTILWRDSDIGVEWPLALGRLPDLSAKDAAGKCFREAECFA